jgi:hypothetical protein
MYQERKNKKRATLYLQMLRKNATNFCPETELKKKAGVIFTPASKLQAVLKAAKFTK